MSINPEKAMEELIEHGHFFRRSDGWIYAVKPPSKKDLDWYLSCVRTISAWSIGDNPRVRVTCGDGVFGLMWKLAEPKIQAPAADTQSRRVSGTPGVSQEMGVVICCQRCEHRCHGRRNPCGSGTEMGGCGCMSCACTDCANMPGVEK